jgi:predicted ATPase/DNA-binding CsgD family transcriptional regulator
MDTQSYRTRGPQTSEEEAYHDGYALRSVLREWGPLGRPASPASRWETATLGIVDRADELAAIRSHLLTDNVRLLTLTGPAGVGKTRLALEVGRALAPHFADGVSFVDLSSLRHPSFVFEVLAQSLDTNEDPADESLPERLAAALRGREMLIILDNAEQVLPGVSRLAELLVSAPRITLLVTSREALHLRWEHIFRLPPLALPDSERLPPLEELSQTPSVALFVQRAQAIDPNFALTGENAHAIAELCVHLDGLPLAIELAAARTTLLSPQMILKRLGQRLSLLRWSALDLPERQRTLRSAIAWSYELLSTEEQTFFRHLGIFAGSFSLRAAEMIAAHLMMDPLESLASLVDKSLVQVQGRDQDNVRYALLESTREYARERLVEAGEHEEAGRIHANYYLILAEQAEPELVGPEQRAWFLHLENELSNVWAARCWMLDRNDQEGALRLGTAMGWFWFARGYHTVGWRQLEDILSSTPEAGAIFRARAMIRSGLILNYLGDLERSKSVLEEAQVLAQGSPDPYDVVESRTYLGARDTLAGRWTEGVRRLEEQLIRWRELEGRRAAFHQGYTLSYLAAAAVARGAIQEAASLLSEAVERHESCGDSRSAAVVRFRLAVVLTTLGDRAGAVQLVQDGLRTSRLFRDRLLLSVAVEAVLDVVGDGMSVSQRMSLLGGGDALSESVGLSFGILERSLRQGVAELREQFQQEELGVAYRAGRSLSFEAIAELASELLAGVSHEQPGRDRSAKERNPSSPLSPREQEVLNLVARGLSDKQIAQEIIVSRSTVHYHMTSIFNKLGVDSRAHAVAVAAQRGLVLLDEF